MSTGTRTHPCEPLALLPLLAGIAAWMFTEDWRWAALGVLGLVALACVAASLAAHKETPK